jgi:hypothetical protein
MENDMELLLARIEDSADAYNVNEYSRRSRLEISPDQSKCWHHELHWSYSDGTQTTLTGDHLSGEVLPANPGFEIINVEFDLANDCPMIERQPVIGWRAVYDRYHGDGELQPIGQQLRPLVQHLNRNRIDISGVRQPDGRVLSRGHWYVNEDAFLEVTKSLWLQKKERMLLEERHKDCPFCAHNRRQADDDVPF